ncbi:UNVERIFIED_CONTAM: hypothetical protein Sradi_7151200 [Sesamum radiatum]|uniref:Uncharacterized protein n=1 Tax=Sesamum radiatum TaxID=300843 RepID=A0AAW2IY28_SESRA
MVRIGKHTHFGCSTWHSHASSHLGGRQLGFGTSERGQRSHHGFVEILRHHHLLGAMVGRCEVPLDCRTSVEITVNPFHLAGIAGCS